MPTPRPSRQRRTARAGSLLRLTAALLGCALLPVVGHAEATPATQQPELSNAISDELGKLRPIMEADDPKTYPELSRKLDEIMAKYQPKGYDLAYVSQLKANILFKSGEATKAIPYLENCLNPAYMAPEQLQGLSFVLTQLYMQEAGLTNDEKLRDKRLGQSKARLEEWFAANKEPKLGSPKMKEYVDATSLYANCLYFLKEYKKSYEVSKKLVRLSIEPNDQAWILLFAAQQESGDNAQAAETFEMFIRKFPEKKDIWLQLTQAYLSSDQALRAILTYQRAQTHGFMNSPSDYMNIFSLYYRLEEYSRASQLLESWIKSGKVEDTEDNWENVSVCFQNLRREDAVRAILDSARKRFKTGNLDFQLAQFLWYDGKYKEGLEAAELAWKKGGLKRAGKTALFLATANFEQRNFERALEFFELAKKSGEIDAAELGRVERILREAVDIIKERESASAAPKS